MTVLFRAVTLAQNDLVAAVAEHITALLPQATVIDQNLASTGIRPIDILAVDATGRLVLVNCDVHVTEQTLTHAFAQMQWVREQAPLLRRLFFSERIDFSVSASIVLVAPTFSPSFSALVRSISGQEIVCVRYHSFLQGDSPGIFFEPLVLVAAEESTVSAGASYEGGGPANGTIRSQQLDSTEERLNEPQGIGLTAEEIAEFMNFDRAHIRDQKSIS